jgi:hypothetical protein
MTNQLSKAAQELLDKLVADYSSKMREDEREFNPKHASSYIYNLFRGEYNFSYKTYKELFDYLSSINYPSDSLTLQ